MQQPHESKSLSKRTKEMRPRPEARYCLHPQKYTGPRAEDVLVQRQLHLSAGQYHFYRNPLMLVEASMQYCFDDKGKQYLDCYSNVCHVGHCHPYFVKQTSAAMHNIISNTRYLHPTIVEYAERLKSKFPPGLSVCYFVNSGSEANDLAFRLARVHTKKQGVVCLQNAYHGTTASCTGVSTSLSTGTTHGTVDYDYCARDVGVVPVPDPYRGEHTGPDAGERYAEYVDEKCRKNDVAAFIHESVQGVGGQIVYPRDYLQRAYEAVRNSGGVTIADEVQTGFGRTGTHFWAFEAQGVVPDIVTLGKPIGNGFPLGAVITTREIAQSFDGVQYFNTNGGNPVACAAGLAVLDIIERDHLQTNALNVSEYLMDRLAELKERHPDMIGDVRGVGLFVGIELIKDRHRKTPADKETKLLMEILKDEAGLLVGKGGQHNNVIRLKPPLCFNTDNCDYLVQCLDELIPEAYTAVQNGIYDTEKQRLSRKTEGHDTYVNCAVDRSTARSRTPAFERTSTTLAGQPASQRTGYNWNAYNRHNESCKATASDSDDDAMCRLDQRASIKRGRFDEERARPASATPLPKSLPPQLKAVVADTVEGASSSARSGSRKAGSIPSSLQRIVDGNKRSTSRRSKTFNDDFDIEKFFAVEDVSFSRRNDEKASAVQQIAEESVRRSTSKKQSAPRNYYSSDSENDNLNVRPSTGQRRSASAVEQIAEESVRRSASKKSASAPRTSASLHRSTSKISAVQQIAEESVRRSTSKKQSAPRNYYSSDSDVEQLVCPPNSVRKSASKASAVQQAVEASLRASATKKNAKALHTYFSSESDDDDDDFRNFPASKSYTPMPRAKTVEDEYSTIITRSSGKASAVKELAEASARRSASYRVELPQSHTYKKYSDSDTESYGEVSLSRSSGRGHSNSTGKKRMSYVSSSSDSDEVIDDDVPFRAKPPVAPTTRSSLRRPDHHQNAHSVSFARDVDFKETPDQQVRRSTSNSRIAFSPFALPRQQ